MNEERIYIIKKSVTFARIDGRFGAFSNMAANHTLYVNDINIATAEALYQSCKFPLFPKVQHEILSQRNPMLAKQCAKKYEHLVRQDWDEIKFRVMRWCLRVKLIQNWKSFSSVLIDTGDLPIVEYSQKDPVWGAAPDGHGNLKGVNALGRLLMELRSEIDPHHPITKVMPPAINGFLLYGHEIGTVYSPEILFED